MDSDVGSIVRDEVAERNHHRSTRFLIVFIAVELAWFLADLSGLWSLQAEPVARDFVLFSCLFNIAFLAAFQVSGARRPRFLPTLLVLWTVSSRMYQVILTDLSVSAVATWLMLFAILSLILSLPRTIAVVAAVSFAALTFRNFSLVSLAEEDVFILLLVALFMVALSVWNFHEAREYRERRVAVLGIQERNRDLVVAREKLAKLASELAAGNESLHAITERLDKTIALQELVLRLNYLLIEHQPLERYLAVMLGEVVRTMGHTGPACILLCDPEGENLRVVAPIHYDPVKAAGYYLKMEDTFQYRETGGNYTKTIIIRHISRFMEPGAPPILDRTDGSIIDCSLSSPVFIDDKLYGIINLDSSDNDAFDDKDIEVMEYVRTQVATVLRHFDMLRKVDRLSRYDQLTGFLNRWAIGEIEEMIAAHTSSAGTPLTIAMIDIDGLKGINDRFGHAAGDQAIVRFSRAVGRVLGKGDRIVRMGGDEFLLVLPGRDESDASAFLDRAQTSLLPASSFLREESGEPPEGQLYSVSFSFGIARAGVDGSTYDDLAAVADRRLYELKNIRYGCR